MESILLSLISSYLKDYVNNFRKEQISVNFLRGVGVIRDLDINVDAINDTIFQSGAPGLRFTRIIINTLSIDAPFMSLKTKPVVVHIDQLFVEIGENIDIIPKPNNTIPIKKSTSKYGFTDRVADSISFEVNTIFVALRTFGRLKTTEVGPWTPPVLLLEMTGNKFVSTNHNGNETELEECFRIQMCKRPILFVYKKFFCKKVTAYLINPTVWFSVADEIIHGKYDNKSNLFQKLNKKFYNESGYRGYVCYNLVKNLSFGFNIAMRKRLDKNILLGFEIAFVFDNVQISLHQNGFSESVHLLIGILYALSRKDVTEEIYGPNPHNEKNLSNTHTPTLKSKSSASNSNHKSGTFSFFRSGSKEKSKELFGKDEIANLEQLDAEISKSGTTISINDQDWQRSSLDDENDPPHLRLVVVFELSDVLLTLSFDDLRVDPTEKISSASNSNARRKFNSGSLFRGVNIHLLGFVYNSIWPEHATPTESVLQITFKSFVITDFVGVRKTCLFRTTLPLDHGGKSICISLLERGVKEVSHSDPETQPGISFAYRRDLDFPPPPISKRIASHLDIVIGNIEFICNLDAWYWFLDFIVESWDDRWISGMWGDKVEGRLEDMLGLGSNETMIIFNSVQLLVYPDFIRSSSTNSASNSSGSINVDSNDDASQVYSNTILPSQIIIDIGFTTLIWKHSLNLKILSNINSGNEDPPANFPSEARDVTNLLKRIQPIKTIDLLSERFEASINDISVKVITDITTASNDIVPPASIRNYSDNLGTPSRVVVHPFNILFQTSIDPNPDRTPITASIETFSNPYLRLYYWALNSSTIKSTYIQLDGDVRIECSCIDITRLTHIVQLLNNWISGMASTSSTLTATATSTLTSESSPEILKTSEASTILDPSDYGYPVTIMMVYISKLKVLLLKDDDTVKRVKDGYVIPDVDIILGIQLNSLEYLVEWNDTAIQPTWQSDNLLMKAELGGISILAGSRPVLMVINDELDLAIQLASISGGIGSIQSLNTAKINPVLKIRYVFKNSQNSIKGDTNIDSKIDMNHLAFKFDIFSDGRVFECGHVPSQSDIHTAFEDNGTSIEAHDKSEVIFSSLYLSIRDKTKVILSLQNIDEALQSFLSELLSGAGVIFSNSEDWLDSSILGYIMRIYREIAAENVNSNDIIINPHKSTSVTNETKGTIKSDSRPMTLSFDIDNSELILLDVHPHTKGDYVGFGSRFTSGKLDGYIRLPHEPLGMIIHWKSSQQLYLFSGFIGSSNSMEKNYITNIFPVTVDAHKVGIDPLKMKSSLILEDVLSSVNQDSDDIAKRLINENLAALKKGITLFSSDRKGIVHYVQNSWSEISYSTSQKQSKLDKNDAGIFNRKAKDAARMQMESLLGLTMELLDRSKVTRLREKRRDISDSIDIATSNGDFSENNYKFDTDDNSSHNESERNLVDLLRAEIQSNYKRLQKFSEKYNEFPAEILSTVEDVDRILKVLEVCFDKLHQLTILSFNQLPTYCGWVRRVSNNWFTGLLSGNNTGSSISSLSSSSVSRYWCLLVRDTLYFMSQPYARKIEYEIVLDKSNIVIDPDDYIDAISGNVTKTSLSTKLNINRTSSHADSNNHISNDDNVLILDCETLDEKCMWKDALKPWILAVRSRSSNLSENKKGVSSFKRNSLSSGSYNSLTAVSSTTGVDSEPNTIFETSFAAAASRSTVVEFNSKIANPFRSATKGMLKAISLSRKSVTKTVSKGVSQSLNTAAAVITPTKHMPHLETVLSNASSSSMISPSNFTSARELNYSNSPEHIIENDLLDRNSSGSDSNSNIKQFLSQQDLMSSISYSPYILPSEIMLELDELRKPLEQYSELMTSLRSSFLYKFQETKQMIDAMRDSFLALFLGLSILHTIEDENDKVVRDEVTECRLRINTLLKDLHEEKAKNSVFLVQWAKAKQLARESESVLHACTMQHITTVLSMSKQMDDLMDQYNLLKMGAQDAGYFALSKTSVNIKDMDPVSPQDLIRQLANALYETETALKQSHEKETMMVEEVDSIILETDYTRQQNLILNETVESLKKAVSENEIKFQQHIEISNREKILAEKERDMYKNRYESLLEVLKGLGVEDKIPAMNDLEGK